MNFELVASDFFMEQIKNLNEKTKRQIKNKIELVKQNPFHFKKLHSKKFSKVYRIRINIDNVESRLVYVILGSKIILACILDRKDDYRNLEYYLENTSY